MVLPIGDLCDDGLVERVAVVGPGGAGKSTFARQLGQRSGLPVVHLDQHFWKPGWVETPKADWAPYQERLFGGDRWIADGNYGGTLDVRLRRADTVIILALRPSVCVLSALHRTVGNHGVAVQAAGCPERLDTAFLRWIWRYQKDSRPRLDEAVVRHCDHLDIIQLVSRRKAQAFLDQLTTVH